MAGIQPSTGNPPVQAFGLASVPPSLQCSQLQLGVAVEAQCLQTIPVAGDGRVLDPQINTDRLLGRHGRFHAVLYWKTQPPLPHGILGEAALLPFHSIQALTLEYPEGLPAEAQRLALALQAGRL